MLTNRSGIDLHKFSEALRDLSTGGEIRNFLQEMVDRLGFTHFAYHVVKTPDVDHLGARQVYGLTTYPTEWLRHYVANGYVHEDPVVAKVFDKRSPFVWGDAIDAEELSKKQRQLLEDAQDAGLKNGLTIPLMSRNGEVAALSLIPGSAASETMRSVEMQYLVQLLALHLHDHAARVVIEEGLTDNSRRRKTLLSNRESEALSWVARGKSTWDISRILEISEKSVEFYLDSAKRKLQATNRTQAVVKAIVLGLIRFDP
ncbi:LuxR family transcriptional regulator [Nguyenibacter vanlangensis]|uniref:LuxR family transcriptional regulator n=1 Tax=Nguyenibacter vanlangensis TaxID=1216886 RepID=A0ABZ3D2M8_9PROT